MKNILSSWLLETAGELLLPFRFERAGGNASTSRNGGGA